MAAVHSLGAHSATAAFFGHLCGPKEDGGKVLEPADRTERDSGREKGQFLGGLRQPVFSSLVNAASVLRGYKH